MRLGKLPSLANPVMIDVTRAELVSGMITEKGVVYQPKWKKVEALFA